MMTIEVKTGKLHTANDLFWAGLLATESIAICAGSDESQIDSKLHTAVKFYMGLNMWKPFIYFGCL